MLGNRNSIVLLFLFVLLSIDPITSNALSQDEHGDLWQFVRKVVDIREGKNVERAHTIIPEGARLIYGARYENLRSVVAGEIKNCSLADTSYHGVMIQAKTNPSEDAGYLVLKTVKNDTTIVRFHTIVFMKDTTGQYKVSVWHAGE